MKRPNNIIRDLFQAIRFARGDATGGKATVYRVRHQGDRAIVETKGKPPRIVRTKP
jgi:hypothetical protein